MSEQQPLLHVESGRQEQRQLTWRAWMREKLERKSVHVAVIVLISIDIAIVLADLSHTFLSDSCTPQTETPLWLEILSHISLVITITFLVELIVSVWAFGPRYYSPFRSVLHFCDGSVIIMTFVVEVGLRGRERELAALLIFFRLLRFAGEAAVGVGELDEGIMRELEVVRGALAEKTASLDAAQREIAQLKARPR